MASKYYISPPPMNPVTRVLAAVFTALALLGAFFFGFVIFIAALGMGLILWLVLAVRGWWLRRKGAPARQASAASYRETIDAEYTVISKRRD